MEESKKKRSANYSRTKGHVAEQQYAIKFRELGYPFCRTTRESSRLHDACKIDLHGIPFNVQIKCGFERNRPNAQAIFTEMRTLMKKNIEPGDPIHTQPRILIHKSKAYTDEGELVTMTWADFQLFLKAYKQVEDNDRSRVQSTTD
jgi:hypothetical protein